MTTMDERVEATCIALDPKWAEENESVRTKARIFFSEILAAAFPELHGDKPTHWLAPMEATAAMQKAVAFGEYITTSFGDEHYTFDYVSGDNAADIFVGMRDAYLGKGDE